MNAETRLEALRDRMAGDGSQAAMITARPNLVYLTGFEGVLDPGVNGACLVTADTARFFTDKRYAEAAIAAAAGTPWEVVVQRENLYVELCQMLVDEGVEMLVMESSAPYGRFAFVSQQFTGAVRVVDHYVEDLRQVKDDAEIERIAAAATLADRAFDHILGFIAPGVTEAEIALELEFYMRRNGSGEMPFPPIVASGANGARPHAIPGSKKVERGDLVVLDFGATVGDYCSDMTRTVAIGSVSDEKRALYDAVLAANEAALATVRAGVTCVEVDRAARDVLESRGLGDAFTHGVGHGVGLDVHELPIVGSKSEHSCRERAVITIEPGVYVSGVAGVRIEDLVVVEEGGHRRLTAAPKELITV